MEKREGYKKTKIGWIPEHWKTISVGETVKKIVGGGTPSRERYDYYIGTIPWITVKDLSKSSFYKNSAIETISEEGVRNSSTNLISRDNVIISTRMGLGKGFINSVDMAINQDMKALYLDNSIVSNSFFLSWYLSNSSFIESLGTGTTVKGITLNTLKKLPLALPPLSEQKRIASTLTTVDDKISSIENQIQQTEQLKKGLMEKLLTEGIGHTEFKETKIGRIPKGWDVKLLKNVASIERGKFQHRPRNDPRFYGGDYPFVQTGDVGKSKGRLGQYSQTLNEKGLAKSKLFPRGTIIITIAANIGDTAIAYFDVAFPDSLVGIIPGREMDVIFLEYYLRTQKNHLNKLATVNAQKNINLETLKPLSTPVPPIEEQKQIATILSTVDDKIEVLTQKKSHYQTLKKGLSQQLLTGQMRVKI